MFESVFADRILLHATNGHNYGDTGFFGFTGR